jgi:hypothetical protein
VKTTKQEAAVELVKRLHDRGIGFVTASDVATRLGTTSQLLTGLLAKLVKKHHVLRVSKENLFSLSVGNRYLNTYILANFYTIDSVLSTNVPSIVAQTNKVREIMYYLAEAVLKEGSELWEAYVGISSPKGIISQKAKDKWRTDFAEALFSMLMVDPGNEIWDQLEGALLLPMGR